jgi:pyruvate formate lyase activating enzyme
LVDDDGDPSIWIDRQRCTKCGRCVEICPTTALSFDGQRLSSEAVVDILLRDKQFYQQSGGGITISGGDPLIQHHFAAEILRQCRAAGVHTAVETCLQGSWNTIKTFLPITDLFIVDLKLADNTLHQKYTGHSNRLIQENYRRLASIGCDMLTRIPLIPRITARPGNIQDIAQFIRECNPNGRVELINFNPLAKGKYRLMSRNQGFFQHMEPLKVDELAILHAILEAEGLVAIREN